MNFSRKKILSFVGVCLFLFPACSALNSANQNGVSNAPTDVNQNAAAPVKDDPEELEKIIKLPYPPEEATWREESTGAPNSKKLTAVISFTGEDARRISESGGGNSVGVTDIEPEAWFPAELIAQSQLSGDETLKGVSFSADAFLQAPYNAGKITRIDSTNYFVLELLSK